MKKLIGLGVAVFVLFPTSLIAAPRKPALEVVVLGSGGPRPFGRGGSSYIVLVDGTPRILVDAGPGALLIQSLPLSAQSSRYDEIANIPFDGGHPSQQSIT